MTTLTIELPPKLKQQLQNRGISNQQLTVALTQLIELYLNNYALQQTLTVMDDIFQQVKAPPSNDDKKIEQMYQASQDPLFMADLQESMEAFTQVDNEWWEPGA